MGLGIALFLHRELAMGKISKALGVPQPMECPHCRIPMEPKRTLGAKISAVAGFAAAGALGVFVPPAGAAVGVATAGGYATTKSVFWRCVNCGFEFSEKAVDQAIASGRSKRLQDEEG